MAAQVNSQSMGVPLQWCLTKRLPGRAVQRQSLHDTAQPLLASVQIRYTTVVSRIAPAASRCAVLPEMTQAITRLQSDARYNGSLTRCWITS